MAIAEYFGSLDPVKLLNNLPSGIGQGIIWGIMALGIYITFRLLDIADLTVDGTFATGGAVTVMLLLAGVPAPVAILIALIVGIVVGCVTGLLHTLLGIPAILSGILVQFMLWSVNLRIMGMASNKAISVDKYDLIISSRYVPSAILTGAIFAVVLVAAMYWYFGTEQGSAIRATGTNPAMAKAQGININVMKVIGLALSNGLVALSGGLMAQYQGFADVSMGRGAIVIGLAAVIIGEVLCDAIFKKRKNFAIRLVFVALGGVVYYMVVVVVLWLRLNSNDLKLFTALIVAVFLAIPYLRQQQRSSFRRLGKINAKKEASDHA
jgi:putative ABC transport system permease protein